MAKFRHMNCLCAFILTIIIILFIKILQNSHTVQFIKEIQPLNIQTLTTIKQIENVDLLPEIELLRQKINQGHRMEITNKLQTEPYQYINRYPDINKCSIRYKSAVTLKDTDMYYNYSIGADKYLYEERITKALLFYFPTDSFEYFIPEFRWAYRSWIEMQRYEPNKWRTDLLVFIDKSRKTKKFDIFDELNCKFDDLRKSKNDEPKCVLIDYIGLADRHFDGFNFFDVPDVYNYLFDKINIFDDNFDNLRAFYTKLRDINHYSYTDSILVIFDGYKYMNDVYDFVLRTDIDIFIAPLFGTWLPRYCNDFVVGNGGYTTHFNSKRLKRIAKNLNLKYASKDFLGSTWYSTPKQFRLAAYLTLVSMIYISNEEFTYVERKGLLETRNWPDWHYGVLLYYGQHIALNHLSGSEQINLVSAPLQLDVDSTSNESVFRVVHIHQYHSPDLFSKFAFKKGEYNNMTVTAKDKSIIKYYCLWLALESKEYSPSDLNRMRLLEAKKKQ